MLIAVVAVSTGEAILAKGMKQPLPDSGLATQIRAVVTNRHVICGTLLMALYFGLYMYSLRLADFSFVLPLSAASYILGALLAKWYLGEQISPLRWIGTLVITSGVILIGLSAADSSQSP